MPHKQINKEERIELAAYKKAGMSNKKIAELLGRHPCTIGRELKRNKCEKKKRYLPGAAEKKRKLRKKEVNQQFCKIISGSELSKDIDVKLKLYWSPEQIAGRLRVKNNGETVVCHETIYRYIHAHRPELKKYLRCQKGKYRRKYGTKKREKQREEKKKKRIDTRPKVIEKRKRIGDFEGDTIVGKERHMHILTHVDRKSGILFADKLNTITAEYTRKRTVKRFSKVAKKRRCSITYDNGVQFNEHEMIERELGVPVYFAYPYHSWERGTNENTNGLLRQFYPKGMPFKDLTQRQINRKVKLINTRPRKRLNYLTPEEVFYEKRGCDLT